MVLQRLLNSLGKFKKKVKHALKVEDNILGKMIPYP
jgi:hypothetical protein